MYEKDGFVIPGKLRVICYFSNNDFDKASSRV